MGQELVYGIGALVLVVALAFATLQYRNRNRAATRVGEDVARQRYRDDDV